MLSVYQTGGGQKLITGLASDLQPVSPEPGWIFIQKDTGKFYFVVAGVWTEVLNSSYALAGATGLIRLIVSIAVDTTAGNTVATDYVYLVSGTTTLTLPTAVANLNKRIQLQTSLTQ